MSDGYEFAVAFVRSRYGTATPPDWRTRCQTVAARLRNHMRGMTADVNETALIRRDELETLVALLEGAK